MVKIPRFCGESVQNVTVLRLLPLDSGPQIRETEYLVEIFVVNPYPTNSGMYVDWMAFVIMRCPNG